MVQAVSLGFALSPCYTSPELVSTMSSISTAQAKPLILEALKGMHLASDRPAYH
jgi:hypothetical protein